MNLQEAALNIFKVRLHDVWADPDNRVYDELSNVYNAVFDVRSYDE